MNITDLTPKQLCALLSDFSPFRAKQVYGWIQKGCYPEEMHNVPADVIARIKELPFGGVEILNLDQPFHGVIKYLNRLDDGNVVESVLMEYKHGNTLCISSQVGCAMGCDFCASTLDGVVRNLTAGEMAFSVARVNRKFSTKERRGVTNIVVMGSGEPLLNLDNLITFIETCRDGMGISPRNISISTCGIVEGMVKLAGANLGCNLCLSLHAPNDELRKKLMPIAQKYTIQETLAALNTYFTQTGRRVLIEYLLIRDVNDQLEQAQELAGLLSGLPCHVNLIPFNTVAEKAYQAPEPRQVKRFLDVLLSRHVSATTRRELGDQIDAACGQLRRKYMKKEERV